MSSSKAIFRDGWERRMATMTVMTVMAMTLLLKLLQCNCTASTRRGRQPLWSKALELFNGRTQLLLPTVEHRGYLNFCYRKNIPIYLYLIFLYLSISTYQSVYIFWVNSVSLPGHIQPSRYPISNWAKELSKFFHP